MNETIYLLCQLLVVVQVFVLIAIILIALQKAMLKLEVNANRQKRLLLYTLGVFIFWLSLLSVLSYWKFFQNFNTSPPRFFFVLGIPAFFILILMTSKSFSKILHQIPIEWLTYAQSFRILMELILWLGLIGGFVPFQMTFEGLNYDILVGLTALLGGYVFFGHGRYRRFEAIIWNISGITLLLNIVIIAILSAPFPFRVFMNEPANVFVTYVPFIWIPGFIVPFALSLHLFSLKKLIMLKQPEGRSFSIKKRSVL